MELPMRFLILLMLALIVLVAIMFGIINPLNTGIGDAGKIAERTATCNKWNVDDCKGTPTSDMMSRIGCSDANECRTICRNNGFCS